MVYNYILFHDFVISLVFFHSLPDPHLSRAVFEVSSFSTVTVKWPEKGWYTVKQNKHIFNCPSNSRILLNGSQSKSR